MNINSLSKQGKKNYRYRYIRALLMLHDTKPSDIATRCKVSRPMVSRVLHGVDKSKKVMTAIAKAVKIPFDELWPI